jgi:glycosyltransferase involved in cell wall biosynthesis
MVMCFFSTQRRWARDVLEHISAHPSRILTKIHRILRRNGVLARRFHPPKNRSVRDVVRILFVGVLSERRGLLELLEATKMLCNNGEKVELWLAGDGPLSPLAHSYAQKYVS